MIFLRPPQHTFSIQKMVPSHCELNEQLRYIDKYMGKLWGGLLNVQSLRISNSTGDFLQNVRSSKN